jgi:uncharacterized membrane-anchored protein
MMDDKRLQCILVGLKRHELTLREKQFIEAVEKYFNEKGVLTDQQESILEGIYREKVWIRKNIFSQNNLPKGSSSKAA